MTPDVVEVEDLDDTERGASRAHATCPAPPTLPVTDGPLGRPSLSQRLPRTLRRPYPEADGARLCAGAGGFGSTGVAKQQQEAEGTTALVDKTNTAAAAAAAPPQQRKKKATTAEV